MTLLWAVMLSAQVAAQDVNQTAPSDTATPVEIVLYSDFQCPYCALFADPLRQLQLKGVDGVKTTVRFKHFPLAIHPKAELAHQAALAAGEQGRFWEMHDLLFANTQKVGREDLLEHAKQLRLDLDRFQRDLESPHIESTIDQDRAEGVKLGVTGTPTFYVNGHEHVGAKSFDELKQLVVREERRARAIAEVTDALMSRGPADAPVVVELFADLQSPVSRPALTVLAHLMARYPRTVRLQFRSFPLAFHPMAAAAHEAAMLAAKAGRFWEFATYIVERQDSLREQDLIALAGRVGLDQAAFAAGLGERRYAARVDADVDAGLKRGIRGSPSIVIRGQRIDGVPSLEMLSEYVDAALSTQRAGLLPR